LGLGVIDHVVPFQVSIKVTRLVPLNALPTAKQLVALAHETPARLFARAPEFGVGATDQVVPCTVSASVRLRPAPSIE
jgi:hypothetical protein